MEALSGRQTFTVENAVITAPYECTSPSFKTLVCIRKPHVDTEIYLSFPKRIRIVEGSLSYIAAPPKGFDGPLLVRAHTPDTLVELSQIPTSSSIPAVCRPPARHTQQQGPIGCR